MCNFLSPGGHVESALSSVSWRVGTVIDGRHGGRTLRIGDCLTEGGYDSRHLFRRDSPVRWAVVWRGNVGSYEPGENGRPACLTFVGTDSSRNLDVVHLAAPGSVQVALLPRIASDREVFDRCPICLSTDPSTEEHVGPQRLGGRALTRTCAPCNNELGSKLDAALVAWCTDTFRRVRFRSPVFQGHRYVRAIDVRRTSDGELVMVVDDANPLDLRNALRHGEDLTIDVAVPNLSRIRMAALKNAYLGVCVLEGAIPEDIEAENIRRVLI